MNESPKRGGLRKIAASRSLRRRAWWCLRKNRAQTIRDIMNSQCSGDERQAENNLRTFLRALARAGILEIEPVRQDDGKPTSNGLMVYRLVRDLGPMCPVLRANKRDIYDPNANENLVAGAVIMSAKT